MDGGDDGYRKFRGEVDESNWSCCVSECKASREIRRRYSAGVCGFRQPAFVEAMPFSWRVQSSEF